MKQITFFRPHAKAVARSPDFSHMES